MTDTSSNSNNNGPVKCQVEVNGVPITLMVDTGSSVTILTKETFQKYFVNEALQEQTDHQTLSSYTKHTIKVNGRFECNVTYGKCSSVCNVYIVEEGTDIMGRDVMKALHINIEGSSLTCNKVEQKPLEAEIVEEFDQLFLATSEQLPNVKGFVHKVKVDTKVTPVSQKLRRLPFEAREKVSAKLSELEKQGIIERIDASEWVSPIVVAWKKSGDVRICVDLRKVNKAVIPDKYPLPKIDEILSELRNSSVFSQLDLASAYHQLKLHEESRHLTAFITHEGLFQYKRMCFGLSSAPSAFQKMMSIILSGLNGVQCYLDDVIVYGKTQAEHDENLRNVCTRLNKYGIKLNMGKCTFSRSTVKFLGHTINENGIQPDDKFQALVNAQIPHDKKSLRSFLGLAGYFTKYIPQFASIVEPLRCLIRGDSKFVWNDKAQESFDKVRQLMGESPCLAMYDPDLETIVTTDASGYGLGAVLTQIKNGNEVTVECASRTLSDAEKKYSVSEKEALACVWACEKWNTYLWGRKFTLRTDHQALVTLLSKGSDRQAMRIARWSCRLMRYNYDVEYKRGDENKVADCLSRLPLRANENEYDTEDEVIGQVVLEQMCKCVTVDKLKKVTENDEVLTTVKQYVEKGWPSKLSSMNQKEAEMLKPFHSVKDELTVCNGIVMRIDRVIIPRELTGVIVNLAHESHQGITRTKQRLRELYWWPLMDKQVEAVVKACVTCQYNDKSIRQNIAPMIPVQYPEKPWSKVAIDIVGPFERSSTECRYAITLIDYYSKWPEVGFTSTVTTSKVITFLKTIFSREGYPDEIISDNGVQFTSNKFGDFCKSRGIKHGFSSLYYPQSNGAVERFNSVVKSTVQNAINLNKPWKQCMYDFLTVYRATPHATTGIAPSVLLHGRQIRTRLNIAGWKANGKGKTEKMRPEIRVQSKQNKYKKYTDRKRNAKEREFKVGDFVRVKKPGIVVKGDRKYSKPVEISRKIGPHTYETSDGKRWNINKLVQVHQPVERSNNAIIPEFNGGLIRNDQEVAAQPEESSDPEPENVKTELRRSSRQRRPPVWFKDYVRY